MGVAKHTAVLTATIDRGHDECRATDGHFCIVYVGVEVCILINGRVFYLTTTGSEYEAKIHGAIDT